MRGTTYLSLLLFSALLQFGCLYSAEKRYTIGQPYDPNEEYYFSEDNPQFEEGVPNSFLDGLGNILGVLSKIVIGDKRMSNHRISEETKNFLKEYIKDNNLSDVKVRFNQYSPGGDFMRLWRSKNVNPLLKWTFGLLTWVLELAFPERIFANCGIPYVCGGDHYNPYTNTIHIYSDLPAAAVHEGGHAKDFSLRKYRSIYTFSYMIPILGTFYPEARASDDAIRYFRYRCDLATQMHAFHVLYPAYGSYIGGQFIGLVGVIPGYIVGSRSATEVLRQEPPRECQIAKELESKKK
ncbi:hypothetical protein LEP1GSC050_2101 [Leptospira broomii serovar Hurstbridge str. 5399]|uniref:Uncharacterized protein n=1 Tax=Leptospira broomii serovar Hurstbridge str. 5399 TaxID=1049789 RepID=T0FED1_9LEPT|nr:hypothetical protein [Leptospira broomii]EQA46231.1 hypothetical protein LEP1GSC050_2101 [Leptospira broomii serovar Hurstbridge str. 5399]